MQGMGQSQGGGNRAFFGGEGEDMDVDGDPFINLGLGGQRPGGTARSQSFNVHGPGWNKEKVQDPAIEHDLNVSLEDVLRGESFFSSPPSKSSAI